MSEGSVYRRKSDGNWCAKYKSLDGKYVYIYRKTRQEAKQALRAALKLRDEGRKPLSRNGGVTVAEAIRVYLNGADFSERTLKENTYLINKHILPALGDKKVSSVNPDTISALYRQSSLAPTTLKRLHTVFRNALPKQCIGDVKPPRARNKDVDILSKQQLLHLLHTVKEDRYEGVFYLMALCALRVGEALALRWDDINFEDGTVRIRRTLWQGRVSSPKTPSSRRTIKLPRRVLDVLQRGTLYRDGGGVGYVFANTTSGKPVDYANFCRRHWQPAIRKAGLPTSITPHKLRHGAASLLLNDRTYAVR